MPIIAVANLKGGVGKSTISQNLAVALARSGRSVCLVDTDSEQRSTLEWAARRDQNGLPKIETILVGDDNLASKAALAAEAHEFVVIDGSPALSEITTKIVLVSDLVIVPVMPSGNDFGALEKFLVRYEDTRAIQKRHGIETAKIGVAMNEYDGKAIVNRTIFQAIERLGVRIFDTKIAHRVAFREANLTGCGVLELSDKKAISEIEKLLAESLELLKN